MRVLQAWRRRAHAARCLTGAALAAVLVLALPAARAADPQRGQQLYSQSPAPGRLGCIDCHSEDPTVSNFGNIFAGRNAVALINRAVQSNTGGMGYFSSYYSAADLADIAAYLGNTPTALTFGLTAIGERSSARSITISASSKQGLAQLSAQVEGDFALTGGNCGTSLGRNSSCSLALVFQPSGAGSRSGALLISHDGLPSPVRIVLQGEAPARPPAVARVAPTALDFGQLPPGSTALTRSVALRNDSSEALTLQALTIDGAGAAAFQISGGSCLPGRVLAAGQACAVLLQPLAGAAGSGLASARLLLLHDGETGRSSVPLSAMLLAPPTASLQADVRWLALPDTLPGQTSPARLLTLHNPGPQPWLWRSLASDNAAFRLEPGSCGGPGQALAAGQHCQVLLRFSPSRSGPFNGQLTLGSASGQPTLTVALQGLGLPSTQGLAELPGRLRLQAAAGQATEQQALLRNRGNAPLRLGTPALQGAQAAAFALTLDSNACSPGTRLAPGEACTVRLRWTAAASADVAPHTAQLLWPHDGADSPAHLGLSGRTLAAGQPQLALDATQLNFGRQAAGTSTSSLRTLQLANSGSAALRWATPRLTGAQAADFSLVGNCPAGEDLPAGGRCSLQLRFQPQAAGPVDRQATLWLGSADGRTEAVLPLRGQADGLGQPRLQSDRLLLDLGSQSSEAPAGQTLVVHNTGSATLPALRWRLDGPFRLLAQDAACSAALPPGAACRSTVAMLPGTAASLSGTLWAEAGGTAWLQLPLRGQRVDSAAVLVAQPQGDADVPTGLLGAAPASRRWTVRNLGNAPSVPLAWAAAPADSPALWAPDRTQPGALWWRGAAPDASQASAESGLQPGGDCAGAVLAPGASCTLVLQLLPAQAGWRQAAWSAPGLVQPVTAAVLGLAPVAGQLATSTPALLFDVLANGLPPAQPLWVHNSGTAPLALTDMAPEGPAFSLDRTQVGTCPAGALTLQPGEACSLALAWTGSAAAATGSSLLVSHDEGVDSVALAVREDASLRSNQGQGGGGLPGPWPLLGLALAVAALRSPRPMITPLHHPTP